MVNFSSITLFSEATYALKKSSMSVRLSLRYGAGVGTAYGHLVAKVTNNSTTLTFSTDSKADLKELDALALWLMMAHVQPDAAGIEEKAETTTAEAVLPRAPRVHPVGSGAQRRAAARARAAASGITKPLSTKAKLKLRKLENRTERRRLRAANVLPPRTLEEK